MREFELLLLLVIANGAPVLAHRVCGSHGDWPLDGGRHLRDGRPLLGPAKTWRGLLAAVLATIPAALLVGLAWWQGALVAVLAMAGDLLSSFVKRRLGRPPSSMMPGLDQIPEVLLPALALQVWLGLSTLQVATVVIGFVLLEPPLSWLLYRLKIRNRPY